MFCNSFFHCVEHNINDDGLLTVLRGYKTHQRGFTTKRFSLKCIHGSSKSDGRQTCYIRTKITLKRFYTS